MKTIKVQGEQFMAEKIVKTDSSIIGYCGGKEVFAFRGISDFSIFLLEDDQSFDTDESEILKQELANTNALILELTESILGGM